MLERENSGIKENISQLETKNLKISRELAELHDQHETAVHFQNLYKVFIMK